MRAVVNSLWCGLSAVLLVALAVSVDDTLMHKFLMAMATLSGITFVIYGWDFLTMFKESREILEGPFDWCELRVQKALAMILLRIFEIRVTNLADIKIESAYYDCDFISHGCIFIATGLVVRADVIVTRDHVQVIIIWVVASGKKRENWLIENTFSIEEADEFSVEAQHKM